MTFFDLASIGSFISGIAVLISLIYLSLQIRQNSKHTRALIQQGRLERITNQLLAMADTDLVSAWIIANGDTPTPRAVKQRQSILQFATYFVGWDDTFSQHEAGLVTDDSLPPL